MPYCETYTEAVVTVTVAIVVVEVECSSVVRIVIVTSTFEHRVSRVHKVSVIVSGKSPSILAFCLRSKASQTKSSLFSNFILLLYYVNLSSFVHITDCTLLYCETYTEAAVTVTAAIAAGEEECSSEVRIVIATPT